MAEEELTAEQIAEQIRRLKIEDLVLSTASTLGQLAYAKLDAKELDQARLGIDAIAALLPVLEGTADAQLLRDFNQLLANLRLAFADVVASAGRDASAPEPSQASATSTGPEEAHGDG